MFTRENPYAQPPVKNRQAVTNQPPVAKKTTTTTTDVKDNGTRKNAAGNYNASTHVYTVALGDTPQAVAARFNIQPAVFNASGGNSMVWPGNMLHVSTTGVSPSNQYLENRLAESSHQSAGIDHATAQPVKDTRTIEEKEYETKEHHLIPEDVKPGVIGLTEKGIHLGIDHYVEGAEEVMKEEVAQGKLVSNMGKVYQSPGKTLAGNWKNIGNAKMTTKGIDALEALKGGSKFFRFMEFAGKILEIPGLFDGHDYLDTKDPTVFIPAINCITEDMRKDEAEMSEGMLQHSIRSGYADVKAYLAGTGRSDDATRNVQIREVSEEAFKAIIKGDLKSDKELMAILDKDAVGTGQKNFAVLLRYHDNNKFELLAVFSNIRK